MKRKTVWVSGCIGLILLTGSGLTMNEKRIIEYHASRLSPDSESIVFHSYVNGKARIFKMKKDGTEHQRIQYPATNGNDVGPTWSPDGQKIAFTSEMGGEGIFIMNADDSNLTHVVSHGKGAVQFGSWSLDNSAIYFSGRFEAEGKDRIYRIQVNGSNLEQITETSSTLSFRGPKLSIDNMLYYTGTNEQGEDAIFAMDLSDKMVSRLTNFEDGYGAVDVSPDAEELVFTSQKEGNYEVYMMEIDSGAIVRLTHSEADEYFPTYIPDCSKILFNSQYRGRTDLLSMDSHGGEIERIAKNTTYR